MKTLLIRSLFFCVSILYSNTFFAQPYWEQSFPNPDTFGWATQLMGFDVQQTTDGGYIWVGDFDLASGAIRHYIQLTKTDASGNELWTQRYAQATGAPVMYEEARSVLQTADGGYLIGGSSDQSPANNQQMLLMKTDASGDTTWKKYYGGPGYDLGKAVREVSGGGYILAGTGYLLNWFYSNLVRIDANGDTLWTKTHDGQAWDVQPTTDGGFVLVGENMGKAMIIKTDANGDTTWTRQYVLSTGDGARSVQQTADGGYIVAGYGSGVAGYFPMLLKLDANGDIEWTPSGGMLGGFSGSGKATSVEIMTDGNYLVTGSLDEMWGFSGDGFYGAISPTGAVLWSIPFDLGAQVQGAQAIVTGNNEITIIGKDTSGAYLYHLGASGVPGVKKVEGQVFFDTATNCVYDIGEHLLDNWIVSLSGNIWGSQQTLYSTTDTNGFYSFYTVDTGAFELRVHPPTAHWQPCLDSQVINFTSAADTAVIDFALQNAYDCPLMQVDVSTPFLRRCSTSIYNVSYCNLGTQTATNSYIEIEFDPYLIIGASSIPPTSINGNIYTFDVGDIDMGECGSFDITVAVDCDSTVLGQTHCVEAHIYPDTLCFPPHALWNGGSLLATAQCMLDSIEFTISNAGQALTAPVMFFVTEDDIMMRTGFVQIGTGQDTSIFVPINPGSTYRLEVEQPVHHPVSTHSSVVVEGCGVAMNLWNLGFVNIYAESDEESYLSIDCQENIGSYDPNDKRGFPQGYGAAHYINQNQDLEYHIRFQNTGTDTAFNILIVDTLDAALEITSIMPGASSDPYNWTLIDANIVEFRFDNILLPDSNINEPASHGFVKFRIKQLEDNPLGTIINNRAAIYFDWNPAILTNTTFHEVGENFITVSVDKVEDDFEGVNIMLRPNPFRESTTIELSGKNIGKVDFLLFDAMGREVQRILSDDHIFQLERNNLPTGLYFYRIESKGKWIATGKVVVK